jgi:hypothetical protein
MPDKRIAEEHAELERLQASQPQQAAVLIATEDMGKGSALQAAKARGVRLGNPQLAKAAKRGVAAVRANARQFAANVLPIIEEIERAGITSRNAIAAKLNERNVRTARGGKHPSGARGQSGDRDYYIGDHPVALCVTSLKRPGGNKRLALLRELVPQASRCIVLPASSRDGRDRECGT